MQFQKLIHLTDIISLSVPIQDMKKAVLCILSLLCSNGSMPTLSNLVHDYHKVWMQNNSLIFIW